MQEQARAGGGRVKTVEILVDRTSIEAFVNDGEVSFSACFLPTATDWSWKVSETAFVSALCGWSNSRPFGKNHRNDGHVTERGPDHTARN